MRFFALQRLLVRKRVFIEKLSKSAFLCDHFSLGEWIDKVNRGGLFPLNDESFRFLVLLKVLFVLCYQELLSPRRFYS